MTLVHQRFSPTHPLDAPKLCKKCVFYRRSSGVCKLFGSINLVDGEVAYFPAIGAREHYCKGEYYDDAKNRRSAISSVEK